MKICCFISFPENWRMSFHAARLNNAPSMPAIAPRFSCMAASAFSWPVSAGFPWFFLRQRRDDPAKSSSLLTPGSRLIDGFSTFLSINFKLSKKSFALLTNAVVSGCVNEGIVTPK